MKAYSSLEQSKKLAEFLPLESADMFYTSLNSDYPWIWIDRHLMEVGDIPCWSLSALLEILKYPSLTQDVEDKWFITDWTGAYPKTVYGFDGPIDACYEMILKLHELKIL